MTVVNFKYARRFTMRSKPVLVLITVPSVQIGRQIAQRLLEDRLAAGVNIVPGMNSLYVWQGAIQDHQEALLIVQSRADLFEERLVPAVSSLHPYQVPEIIALPIQMGLQSYLDWIDEVTVATD
jgi:periplasmic divalent cation tolerance protein